MSKDVMLNELKRLRSLINDSRSSNVNLQQHATGFLAGIKRAKTLDTKKNYKKMIDSYTKLYELYLKK